MDKIFSCQCSNFFECFPVFRGSCPEMFYKNAVLENFIKFIGKYLRWSFFFNKVESLNLHKMFIKPQGRLLNVLCTFSIHPVSRGLLVLFRKYSCYCHKYSTSLSQRKLPFYKNTSIFLQLILVIWNGVVILWLLK